MTETQQFSILSKTKLSQILGTSLSEEEYQNLLKQTEILTPGVKEFWSCSSPKKGLYIIITGKIRIICQGDRLLTTLEEGEVFGEASLLPKEAWNEYRVRGSRNLQLIYLPATSLEFLLVKNPLVTAYLKQQALLKDLLILWCQSQTVKIPLRRKLLKILPLLEKQEINKGKVPKKLSQKYPFWLVRKGILENQNGERLTKGMIYTLENKNTKWRVLEPAEIYVLSQSKYQEAVDILPQLDSPRDQRQTQTLPQKRYFPTPTSSLKQWWSKNSKRYPYYPQQSAADCGAACLVMIGRYYGKNFNLNRVREMANIRKEGASLQSLAVAAENLGFIAKPVKATLDKLIEQTLPVIIHWEGYHYVVVYEINRRKVIIGDPAQGQRSLTHAQFQRGWTNHTLLLEPTINLSQDHEKSSLWRFTELIKPHWWILTEVFIASLFIQLFGLVTPVLTQVLLDQVVVQRSQTTLMAVGFGLLICGIFRVAMMALRQYLLEHTANRIDIALIVGFIRHTFHLPLSFFESRYVGDIMSRVQENRKIQRFLTGETISIILDLLTMFVYVGIMFWYSWKLALLVLAVLPPLAILTLSATPFLKKLSRQIFNAVAEENSYLIQALSGVRTVKSMAVEQTVRWQWESLLNKFVKKRFDAQVFGNLLRNSSGILQTLSTTALLWYGAWLVIMGEMSIGQLVAFNMLLGNVISPFQRLAGVWNELQEVTIAVERLNDVLDSPLEEDPEKNNKIRLTQFRGSIRFENVTFRYYEQNETNVLENLSFEIKPNQTIAIVGRSGSGKTTLSKLILGLYYPTSGKIYIDGQDITTLSVSSLRRFIGVVDQDTFLFGGSIWENISLAHPEATEAEIMEAAENAGAHSFIKRLPLGYDTKIGEGGGLLSGGQRQRIAIARALLGKPPLLIFDEATSHLDAESERIIQSNLTTILQDRTTIIIAHRLSTVRNADLILVLNNGLLVESGTHKQLMEAKGTYYYLNQQQLDTQF